MIRTILGKIYVSCFQAIHAIFRTNHTKWYLERAKFVTRKGVQTRHVGDFSGQFFINTFRDYQFVLGPWFEKNSLENFLDCLDQDSSVFEVGGHIGSWTIFIAKRVMDGKLVVFEPSNNNRLQLKENISLNQLKNVVVQECAVGSEKRKADLFTDGKGSGSESLVNPGRVVEKYSVNIEPLDDYIHLLPNKGNIAMKIDCEGSELDVLKGASSLLQDKRLKAIHIEIHPKQLEKLGSSPQEVRLILEQADFVAKSEETRSGQYHMLYVRP